MLTILWDNDGVLVDSEGLYFRATQEVLRMALPLARCGLPAEDIRHATVQPRAERAF